LAEAAILGRVVRRRDDNAVGQAILAPSIVNQDRLGDRRRRGVFAALRYPDLDAVGRQNFERAFEGGPRQRMRIEANE
jgi:ABC-type microcin C transport system duplicated ATPase subunit YejF